MKRRHGGVAAIEFAIVLPLLLAICFAITEFGRAIYTYNTIAKAVRDADRYLSTQSPGDTTAWTTAKNLAVYGNPAGTGSALAPGLTTSKVTILDSSNSAANTNQTYNGLAPTINTVTVTITGYQFSPIIDLLRFTRFYSGGSRSITSITFDNISVTMRQN